MDFEFIKQVVKPTNTKIVMLIMDGLGGLPEKPGGKTELEAARTPNLDKLAEEGVCGLHEPVGPGIIPGSGPSHLAVFGYDPIAHNVGRGVLSALGVDFDLKSSDVAARGNFCTLDKGGIVTDRRAGRISTERNQELCSMLKEIKLPGAEVFVQTEKEHRFLLVLRGEGLSDEINDTDPQEVGKKQIPPEPKSHEAKKTSDLLKEFLEKAHQKLSDSHPANGILLRGFAMYPDWPSFQQVFGLKPAAIAAYPMYRGLAKLIGMEILQTPDDISEEFGVLEKNWESYDFFYVHAKHIDSSGEDGNFKEKSRLIEEVDEHVPRLRKLNPDVIIVTGDHSTPSLMKSHSWHPVPVLLWSPLCRPDNIKRFGERDCIAGGLGARFPAVNLMPLALAHAGRLGKFGA